MPRWTDREAQEARRLHSEGWSHRDIAYILSLDYSHLCKRMARLGLKPNGKPGGPAGWHHTPQARAAISAYMHAHWQAQPTTMRHALTAHARAAKKPRPRIVPPKNTPQGRYYRKLWHALGATEARRVWLATPLP